MRRTHRFVMRTQHAVLNRRFRDDLVPVEQRELQRRHHLHGGQQHRYQHREQVGRHERARAQVALHGQLHGLHQAQQRNPLQGRQHALQESLRSLMGLPARLPPRHDLFQDPGGNSQRQQCGQHAAQGEHGDMIGAT
ncbi:hypothetical protein R5H29_09975 [Stenotrophomonas sp. A3_2]